MKHFSFILVFAVLLTVIIFDDFKASYPGVVLIVGIISFFTLFLFQYWPTFSFHFLPKLETVKEFYEQKQSEHLEKCSQSQLSNPALVLIYYVFDRTGSINSLGCSNEAAALLTQLYGVDQGSLKKNLELFLGSSSKRKDHRA